MRLRAPLALLWLQFRLLRQNRAAWLIVVMLLLSAVALSQATDRGESVCYVVYWLEDDWVRELRNSVPDQQDPRIEVKHVRQFVNDKGVVVYPPNSHSIQLRPPEGPDQRWRIWYWYSGDDPTVLDPAITWFWSQTQRHFHQEPSFEVFVSAFKPVSPLLEAAKLQAREWTQLSVAKPAVFAICLFFCGCYLPVLGIAEQANSRVLDTLATKPTGMVGWANGVIGFHVLLTLAIAMPLMILFGWFSISLGLTTLLSLMAYLGIAFTIGCTTGRVASASAMLVVYGMMSAIACGYSLWMGHAETTCSLEWRLVQMVSAEGVQWRHLTGLMAWCVGAITTGWLAFRRMVML